MDAQDPASNGPGASARRGRKAHAALVTVNADDYDDKDSQDGYGENQGSDHDQGQ